MFAETMYYAQEPGNEDLIFHSLSGPFSLYRLSYVAEKTISYLSPTGKERWSRETISKLLRNEKYIGEVLLQKTFVKDVLTGKQL